MNISCHVLVVIYLYSPFEDHFISVLVTNLKALLSDLILHDPVVSFDEL